MRADFEREAAKMETAVQRMMDRHAQADARPSSDPETERAVRTRERLTHEAARIRAWLAEHSEDRKGAKGAIRLSNRTDNESAKMATGKGVIQGYTGVATVDAKAQVVLDAQAHGTGSEQELLIGAVEGAEPYRSDETAICADAGYHSEANLKALSERGIDAWICDNQYRSRDPRYAGQEAHKVKPDPLWDKSKKKSKTQCFRPQDFRLADDHSHCICLAGKRLYSNGSDWTIGGRKAIKFCGAVRDCLPCALRGQCLRKPDTTKTRQVAFFMAKRHNKRLTRFSLRGKRKVDGQWKLYCIVHNIKKLAHHGYAG